MDLTAGLIVQFVASKWDTIKQNAKNWIFSQETGNWHKNCHQNVPTLDGKTEAGFQRHSMLTSHGHIDVGDSFEMLGD